MSANKRDFTDFKNFAGTYNVDTMNYEFPQLVKDTNDGKKIREWTIYVRLIKEDSAAPNITKMQNWNLLAENQIKIKDNYFIQDEELPAGTLVELWTESGIKTMKISRSAASYITGKNIGKKNQRNSFQQALITARGKYLKKIDEGCVVFGAVSNNIKSLESLKISTDKNTKYFPMLAKNYKDLKKKIDYPVYIQPKLDGVRCLIYLDNIKNPTINNVIMYTRQKKDYPHTPSNDNIRKCLLNILIKNYNKETNESIYLDGELYQNGVSLQQINSATRGDSGTGFIEYHNYDMFYPSYTHEMFGYRTNKLLNVHNDLTIAEKKYIIFVPTHLVKTEEENDKLYKYYLDHKYEGTMIRAINGEYLKSAIKKSESLRAKHLLKRKEIFTDEFEVVNFTDGNNGKEVGAIVWICAAGNKTNDTFSVVPNMTHIERYNIYEECKTKFDKKYKGRMLTVEYRGFSDKMIPTQIKAVGFRDFT